MYFPCLTLFCKLVGFLSLLRDRDESDDSVLLASLALRIDEIVGSINLFRFYRTLHTEQAHLVFEGTTELTK